MSVDTLIDFFAQLICSVGQLRVHCNPRLVCTKRSAEKAGLLLREVSMEERSRSDTTAIALAAIWSQTGAQIQKNPIRSMKCTRGGRAYRKQESGGIVGRPKRALAHS